MCRKKRRGCFGRLFLLFLLCSLLFAGYMAVQSRIVKLCSAELYLKGLPSGFEGATILYVSDVHAGALASGKESARVLLDLQSLYPDLLLLGGDYSGADLWSVRNPEAALGERDAFFQELAWFYAPLGKFAVRGCSDMDQGLQEALTAGGVTLLRNQVARLDRNGDHLILAGFDDWSKGEQAVEGVCALFAEQDTVIALSHDAALFPMAARHGAPDLMLCGAPPLGQIRLPAFLTRNAAACPGWQRLGSTTLLISGGLGCARLPLRLNSPAQVHLITLRRG